MGLIRAASKPQRLALLNVRIPNELMPAIAVHQVQPARTPSGRVGETQGRFYEWGIGARSAAGGMTALSLTPNVRGDRFQMHHYRGCAGDPLMSWRGEPLSFAYFSLRQAKKSRCRPAQGQR